jgi:AraC-like DNA-binding protein
MKTALEVALGPDVQELLDSFCSCFGIRIQFFSPKGEMLMGGGGLSIASPYCSILQKRLGWMDRCLESDRRKQAEAASRGRMLTYRCHAGLREAVMPVYAGGYLLGHVMVGQFRCEDRIPPEVERAWKKKRPLRELRAAWDKLPLVPTSKVKDVLRLFSVIVDRIVSHRMYKIKGDILVEQVRAYIDEHVGERIWLANAAAAVYRSESTVSHLFRSKLGKSFKQVVVEAKLEKAEELMRSRPGITVGEVARMVGYENPFHFSNIYRKYRGFSPSDYLKRPGSR